MNTNVSRLVLYCRTLFSLFVCLMQVSDWFKLYSEEYFETNDDLGETKEASTSFLKELDEFEASSKVCACLCPH